MKCCTGRGVTPKVGEQMSGNSTIQFMPPTEFRPDSGPGNPSANNRWWINPLILGLFTVSGDVFFTLKIGFTFRAFQLLICPTMIAGIAAWSRTRRLDRLDMLLLAWAVFGAAGLANTTFIARSVMYWAWQLQLVVFCISLRKLAGSCSRVQFILRWQMRSFYFVAGWAILQFTIAYIHGAAPLLVEEVAGLPRANGFSYEPSYFVAYLIPGWVLLLELLYRKIIRFTRGRGFGLALLTVALVASTSRIGYFGMGLYGSYYVLRWWRRANLLNRYFIIGFIACFGVAIGYVARDYFLEHEDRVLELLQGTGIAGTAAHSVDDRLQATIETWQAFRDHPMIGCGLGGISENIAAQNGYYLTSLADAKEFESGNITVGVLAAGGIVCSFPFWAFAVFLWRRVRGLDERILIGGIARSLGIALLMQVIVLQFNQNILRNYLWLNVGLLLMALSAYELEVRQRRNRADSSASKGRKLPASHLTVR